jgi:thioredoxin 1
MMKTKYTQRFSRVLILLAGILITSCAQKTTKNKQENNMANNNEENVVVKSESIVASQHKVTFIELGSVRCIPCQQMQSVMKSIKEKYINQVNVVFYDVWTPEGKPYAEQYGILAIPTQVFLDENGKEFFRHEGYFPEEELIKVLKTKVVK